jgi:hypothetical protein
MSTASAVSASPPHKERNLGRSRVTNDAGFLPKEQPSLFQQARRRRDLIDSFLAGLVERGEDTSSPVLLAQVRAAAELVVACEMCRAALLNGQAVNMEQLLRLEGCSARAIRALGLRVEDRAGQPPRGLERARARWAQQESKPENNKTKAATKAGRRGVKPSQQRRRERPPRDQTQIETD